MNSYDIIGSDAYDTCMMDGTLEKGRAQAGGRGKREKKTELTELRSLSFSISTGSPMLTRSILALWLVGTARQEVRSTPGNTWQSSRCKAIGHVCRETCNNIASKVGRRRECEIGCGQLLIACTHPPQGNFPSKLHSKTLPPSYSDRRKQSNTYRRTTLPPVLRVSCVGAAG